MTVLPDLDAVRKNLGRSLFGMVAGPEGPANRARIHDTPGPRWFDEDRPIRRVHADASMFVGGLRALLLQSLHPLAMAGVAAATSVSMLPAWARKPLLLPYFPPIEATVIRAAGRVLVGGIRWALTATR
ncbi:hypothetical protein AAV95_09640 [Mycolicibacterium elephantis]|uniref:oxygenase MpaB family protein n=1 Tax=Mycolicibacterium elephantis TaxID=81858 RepID=UPI000629571D|nr:oxygenase MpaB family protein [Mycolicibacterium elephantis]KKW64890.1 hypothetical protein AAV95_09640 [Mycolicibacterium elephantis]